MAGNNKMDIPQPLSAFFAAQKARYAELFWYEIHDGKIVLMIEKLARQAREILKKENSNNISVVSFEADDSIGDFFIVDADVIDVETRPSREEYESIMDRELKSNFTNQTNDLCTDQLVRVYQPQGYTSWCVVAYHSLGMRAPRGPIGWLRNIDGLRKVSRLQFEKPATLLSFEDACKKYDGVKYQIGGGSFTHGFDCSSLVQRIVYDTRGIWLPRKAQWQALVCAPVEQGDLRQSDLVFFNKKGERDIDHVALVYQPQQGKLPIVFHTKRILGKAMFEDLNTVKWLDIWEIHSFGRVLVQE